MLEIELNLQLDSDQLKLVILRATSLCAVRPAISKDRSVKESLHIRRSRSEPPINQNSLHLK